MALHLHLELSRADRVEDPYALREGPQRYQLRWGPGRLRSIELRWDRALLDAIRDAELASTHEERLLELGDHLRSCLDAAGWRDIEPQLAASLRRDGGAALHISTACAELHDLPWELVRMASTGERLFEIDDLHVRYEWPTGLEQPSGPRAPLGFAEPPRVLLAWSDEGGAVPHGPQLQALSEAWPKTLDEPLEKATPTSLHARLAQAHAEGRPVEVLHLLAHGGTRDGLAGLWLGAHVKPAELMDAVAPFTDSLRLVVLSACKGAKAAGPTSRAGSAALALHRGTLRGGVDTVVGCRTWLSVAGSVHFTRALHGALAQGSSVDPAVSKARRQLRLSEHRLDASGLQVFGRPVGEAPRAPTVRSASPASLVPSPQRQRRQRYNQLQKELDALKADVAALNQQGMPVPAELAAEQRRLEEAQHDCHQPQPDDVFGDGRYKLLERVGEGSFSTVWRAWDARWNGGEGRAVALKILRDRDAGRTERRRRFERGARRMETLYRNRNIVRVVEGFQQQDGYCWFAMEYVPGGTLQEAVEQGRVRDPLAVALALGSALQFAHEREPRLVHRDVKPLNVLLDAQGRPKLTDFDLVKDEDTLQLSRTRANMGSPLFIAPEQMTNAKRVDARADQYALAMIVLFMLDPEELGERLAYEGVRGVLEELEQPEAVKAVLRKGLARKREQRFPSVRAFCEALEASMRAPFQATRDERSLPDLPIPPRRRGSGRTPRIEAVPAPAKPRSPQLSPITAPPTGGLTGERYVALRDTEHPLTFIGLTGGEFTMGSPPDEAGRFDREGPQHRVRVPPLFVATTPVTQAQWRFVALSEPGRRLGLRPEPSRFKGASRPVEQVSWTDALRFAAALSELEGKRAFHEVLADASGDNPG
ncbi:MAG: protein kinase, partial [Alphaproteobacteria bacterium]|nr:protein kinase [Alphaproteobacteria bacterium]